MSVLGLEEEVEEEQEEEEEEEVSATLKSREPYSQKDLDGLRHHPTTTVEAPSARNQSGRCFRFGSGPVVGGSPNPKPQKRSSPKALNSYKP